MTKTNDRKKSPLDSREAMPVPMRDDVQLPSLPSGPSFGTLQGAEGHPMSSKGGRVLGGKFRVIRELGAGGAGAVYEVLHTVTHHKRALKLMKLQDNDENVERIFREASAAGRIGNPHIIETLDAGRFETGEIYVLMELVDGDTLFRYIEKHRSLTLHDVIGLICQAADGLHAAHEAGIVHRDVKPANMMVTDRDGRPFVKLLDFGISKFDAKMTELAELTGDGTLLGTPSYMAPEQLRGGTIDRRVDIFALGVTLYSACAGKRPFQGRTFAEIALAVVQDEHIPLWDAAPHLPPSFTHIVERAMATKPENRFDSCAEFAEALRSELESAFSAVRKSLSLSPPSMGNLTPFATPVVPVDPQLVGSGVVNDSSSATAVIHVSVPPPPSRFRPGPAVAGIVLVASCIASIVAIGITRSNSAANAGTVAPPLQPTSEMVGTPQVQRVEPTAPPRLPTAAPLVTPTVEPKPSATIAPAAIPKRLDPPPAKTATPRTAPSLNRANPY